MPVGRLRSAVEFHQTAAKISHGNPMDTDHGVHLADCDLLLTAIKISLRFSQPCRGEGGAWGTAGKASAGATAAGSFSSGSYP